jgi:hypothetical protein
MIYKGHRNLLVRVYVCKGELQFVPKEILGDILPSQLPDCFCESLQSKQKKYYSLPMFVL